MDRRKRPARIRLTAGQAVGLAELDDLLDVPMSGWQRRLDRLVREFRTKGAVLDVPPTLFLGKDGPGVAWTELFEAQVRQLNRMERADEFRMARRYEFAKWRVRDALLRAGHAKASVDDLVLRPVCALPRPKRAASAEAIGHLGACVEELERMRNLYVEGGLYLVLGPVRRYRGLGVDQSDLIQESCASLFQAIEGFDWRRDVRFKTYALYWVQQAILKTLYNASRTVRIPIWVQKAYRKIRRAQEGARSPDGSPVDSAIIGEQVGMSADRVDEILAVRRFAVSLDANVGGAEAFSLGQSIPDDRAEALHESVVEDDLGARLGDALSDLPDRERRILERRFGLNDAEPETLASIAADLGVTAERVRQLQNAALDKLKQPSGLKHLKAFA